MGHPTCAATQAGAAAAGTLSQKGTNGLMSRTGLPSTMSAPASVSVRPSTHTTRATLSPMGHGLGRREGEQAAGCLDARLGKGGGASSIAWMQHAWRASTYASPKRQVGPDPLPHLWGERVANTPSLLPSSRGTLQGMETKRHGLAVCSPEHVSQPKELADGSARPPSLRTRRRSNEQPGPGPVAPGLPLRHGMPLVAELKPCLILARTPESRPGCHSR